MNSTIVKSFSVEKLRGETEYLEAELSNGKYLRVTWDGDYNHRLLKLFENEDDLKGKFVAGEETGLSDNTLDSLVGVVRDAYEDWMSEETDTYDSGEEKN